MTSPAREPVAASRGPVIGQAPNQVDCVHTTRVFDQCVFRERRSQCFPVPEDLCGPFPLPSGSSATVRVTGISCRVLDAVPAPPPFDPGFKVVTVLVRVDLEITILTPYGLERCRFPAAFFLVRQVVLFAPDGVEVHCEVLLAEGHWCLVVDGLEPQVCCEVELCIQIESTALVHLLIPVAAFCLPTLCNRAAPSSTPCHRQFFPASPGGTSEVDFHRGERSNPGAGG